MILIYIMSSSDDDETINFNESNMNNAQINLETYLDSLDPRETDSLEFDMELYGSIDFSILQDKGFKNVHTIVFLENGGVSELRNIPEGVTYLECSNQNLNSLENLPSSIREVKVNNNHIEKFSGKGYKNLNVLNISNNDLKELTDLPESLETLETQNNTLRKLNLKNSQLLKKLNVSNNPLMVVEYVPPSLEDIQMENNPFTEIVRTGEENKKGTQKKVDFLDALYTYFKLKTNYERKSLEKKRNAFRKGNTKKEGKRFAQQVGEPCIHCKHKDGTLFYTKNNTYYAKCGAKTNTCDLDIQIFKGDYYQLDEVMEMEKDEIELKKENIIQLKMSNLFKYIDEQETNIRFKKDLEEFHQERDFHKETLKSYDQVYNNIERYADTQKKQEKVYEIQQEIGNLMTEYKETQNREVLIAAMEIQKNDLLPALQNLRWLKYDVMDMEEDFKTKESLLVQHEVSLQHKDIVLGKDPKVIKFLYEPSHKKKSSKVRSDKPLEEEKEEEEKEEEKEEESVLYEPYTPPDSI